VVEGVDRVNSSTTHLLMEGARLMDEAREGEADVPKVAQIPPRAESSSDEGWET
jgi:hypothetical protein